MADRIAGRVCAHVETLEDRRLLSVALDFNGGAGGIVGSGFTSILANNSGGGLLTNRLSLGSGKLSIASTGGDLYQNHNNQDNALAVGVDSTKNFVAQTRLTSLPFSANWQYAGVFIATNQDNYVKVQAGYIGAPAIQFTSEIGGVFQSTSLAPVSFAGVNTLDLRLVGDATTHAITAQYRINSDSDANWVNVGNTTNGSIFSAAGKTGILTTNVGSAASVTVPFESFNVSGATGSTSGGSPFSVGPNINTSTAAGNQVEMKIAINPANPNNIATVAESSPNAGAALLVTRSNDGGKTWSNTPINAAEDGCPSTTNRMDPSIAFDAFGNLYVAYLVAKSRTEIRVMVAKSTNNGASFTPAIAVGGTNASPDTPKIATGPDATNLARQTVWITYTDLHTDRVNAVGARSSGLGQLSAFSAPMLVADAGGSFAGAAVGPRGEVAVAWESPEGGQGPANIMFDVNTGGLAGKFGVDRVATATNVGGFDYIPAQPHQSVDAEMNLAFDRSGGPTNGRLYLVYTDEFPNESNNMDIMLRYSDNLGASWSSPVRVNDDSTNRSQFFSNVAVDQKTGNVAVSWLDARNSPGNNTVQEYAAVSTNHGLSFSPNMRVAAGLSNSAGAGSAGPEGDFGDYNGLAFDSGRLVPVWADNSNSTSDNPNGAGSLMDVYIAVITVA